MLKVTDDFSPLLARAAPSRVLDALGQELSVIAGVVASDAAFSIIDGAISGSGHVPSAAGAPPNADTHDLDQSIHVGELIETPNKVQTSVIVDSDHAVDMEFGTSAVLPRPFLTPAVERQRPHFAGGLRDAFAKLLKK